MARSIVDGRGKGVGWLEKSVRRGVCCGVQTRSGPSGGRGLTGVGLASRYETRQVASWRGMSI